MRSLRENLISLFKIVEKPNPLLRDQIVRFMAPLIDDYALWNSEEGIFLPEAFATDPTGWQQALYKMKRAFNLLNDELDGKGELWEAKNKWAEFGEKDAGALADLNKEIQEGLELFGRFLNELTDTRYAKES